MKAIRLGEFRKMTEGLPDDTPITVSDFDTIEKPIAYDYIVEVGEYSNGEKEILININTDETD